MDFSLGVHHVYDNVNKELTVCKSWNDVQNYARIWCERLNEEARVNGEQQNYNVYTRANIEAVFEVCNISWNWVLEGAKETI